MSVPSSINHVDIDDVISNFNMWQKFTSDLEREKSHLTEELDSMRQTLVQCDDRDTVRKQELQDMKSTVDDLHSVLSHRCDLEDENKSLKEEIKDLNTKLKDKTMESESKLLDCQMEMKNLKERHLLDLDQLKEETNHNADKREEEFQKHVGEKENSIRNLKTQLQELEKVKQTEIIKLTMEYDSKLMKMQKQNAHLQTAHTNSSHQELFRKKLMHAREESQREISGLKRTISDLQQRLQQQQKPNNTAPSNAKRMRRY